MESYLEMIQLQSRWQWQIWEDASTPRNMLLNLSCNVCKLSSDHIQLYVHAWIKAFLENQVRGIEQQGPCVKLYCRTLHIILHSICNCAF